MPSEIPTDTSHLSSSLLIIQDRESGMLDPNSSLRVGEDASMTLGADSLLITDETVLPKTRCCGLLPTKSKASHEIPYYNILSVDLSDTSISIKYALPISKHDVSVASLQYAVHSELGSKAEIWVEQLLDRAYGEAQRNKRFKVLINPFGGKGHATHWYSHHAEPIFAAAGCQLDVETTKYSGHASEIMEHIDIDAYDAVVCCSGDGLPYEVFNGLAKKPNAAEALSKLAVALLPCGSGNAMAWNLCGTGSVSLAALTIVKGLRTALDLVSITQGDTRKLSFLSQSYGIVAESDLGTDHLRWMGSARFTYGFLVRLLGKTTYPCDIALKVEIDNKEEIKEHYLAYKNKKPQVRRIGENDGADDDRHAGLPPLKYGTIKDEVPKDWEVISSDTIGNFYAGNMAIMTTDTNFFPASLPSDGLMDVVMIDGTTSVLKVLSMMTAVEKGTFFDIPEVTIRKVSGYRLTPRHREHGFISADGESIPFEPYQVEVHQGLGTVLSKSGHLYEAKGPV